MTFEDVSEGAELPELRFPITLKTLMLQAVGTRDLMPYHWHREFAKGNGVRDAFVNTMFFQALIGRFAYDWAGAGAAMRSATLQMLDQICPGDIAVVSGRVARCWTEEADSLVELDVTVSNALSVGARSRVVLAMPTQDRPRVPTARISPRESGDIDPDMPPEARTALGVPVRVDAPYPVSEQQIAQFCEMVRDENPRFVAATPEPGVEQETIVAPPQSLLIWTMPTGAQCGVDADRPDIDLPDQPPWPRRAIDLFGFKAPGTTDVIATDQVVTFGAPIRPGDRIHVLSTLANCTARKQTKLGEGYFVTTVQDFLNQDDELLGRMEITVFHYSSRSHFAAATTRR